MFAWTGQRQMKIVDLAGELLENLKESFDTATVFQCPGCANNPGVLW